MKKLIQENQLTYWVPWAKFFGAMMDINFTLIFLPVSRVQTIENVPQRTLLTGATVLKGAVTC